ncbi:hypothetical protein HYDPIDRAFT_109169 [Hydnomerulius pinastri MD-312]|nr:hypothetical protein HYDPIDRAFT_109169 [Hydnomerulius pinastri MD-312]
MLDLLAVLSSADASDARRDIEEVDRGLSDFRGAFLDFPTTSRPPGRPTRTTFRGSVYRATTGPVTLQSFVEGLWTMRLRPSQDVKLEEAGEGQIAKAAESKGVGSKVRMAARRTKLSPSSLFLCLTKIFWSA